MIERHLVNTLKEVGGSFPVLAITGPRQVGKTTLAKQFAATAEKPSLYIDLEDPQQFEKFSNDTQTFIQENEDKLLVIDEVQNLKSLFPLLRSMVDRRPDPLRFLLLGSASPDMIRHTSQTLAGRIAYEELVGLNLQETKFDINKLWLRGGFPKPFLEEKDEVRSKWFTNFLFTYANRDLPLLGLNAQPLVTERLLSMIAHLNANILNYSTLADSLGMSVNSIKRYIDILEESYLVRRLQPFYININRRLVKSPKIFIRDSGITHHLLNITTQTGLLLHPSIGASFESFAIEQIANQVARKAELSFFATHTRGELDLIISKGINVLAAIEIKYSSTPQLTRGNAVSFQDMKTENKFVVTPTSQVYNVRPGIKACSLAHFLKEELPKIF